MSFPADRKLSKPFSDWTEERMKREARGFAHKHGLDDYESHFVRGGLLNLDGKALFRERADGLCLSMEEASALRLERSKSRADRLFKQKRSLYTLVMLCSLAAAGNTLNNVN